MSRRLLLSVLLLLITCVVSNAGIIRHVVKPVARKAASVSKTVVTKGAHGAKTIVY